MLEEKVIQNIKIKYNTDSSLFEGNSGMLLFEVLANRIKSNDNFIEIANSILNSKNKLYTLCNGKAGINWMFLYLFKNLNIIDKKVIKQICMDDYQLKLLSIKNLEENNFDFLHGSLGVAYYLLYEKDRIDLKFHKKILNLIDIKYKKKKEIIQNDFFLNNYKELNLGLSHGLPSIIRYLGELYKKDILKSKEIIKCLLNKLIEFQIIDGEKSYFPDYYPNDNEPFRPRLAWCYGDLSLCYTMYQVSKIINEKELEAFFLNLLIGTTKIKTKNDAFVFDAGICHGSSGIMHIYNKMFFFTGHENFKKATENWKNITLESIDSSNEYDFEFKSYSKNYGYFINHSLLEGNAGVGLVLYSYLTGDFSWDYCLMLND